MCYHMVAICRARKRRSISTPTRIAAKHSRANAVAPAALVREAVAEYVARHDVQKRPRSVGKFASRRGDLSERAEELLARLPRR